MRSLTIYCILVFISIPLWATENIIEKTELSGPSITIKNISKTISLTGKLDDPLWEHSPKIELKYEIQPGENTPAPQETIVRMLYDDEHIYFGFRCFDTEPEKIRANLCDRDKIFQDDYVIVCIDTYGDHQKGYEMAVNPYGIQGDLLGSLNGEDINYDAIWESAANIDEKGWTAEIKIPFKSIRFPKKTNQAWRLHIVRTIPRGSRTQVSWTPVDRNIPSFLKQSGFIKGLKGIKSSAALELLPYALGQQVGNLKDPDDPGSGFHNDPVEGRFGMGFSYAPSSDFSLDGVINPDFSQIETDAAQISVNTTFALFYSEKRPFFLKGQELLQTPMYYSRSINDPLAAGRIIGKKGSLSYMYLTAYDRNTVFCIPGEEESSTIASSRKSFVNVGRMRYDLGNESFIGALFMSRNISDAYNYLYGFDWNYKFWENWSFNGEGFISQTRELSDTTLFSSKRKFGSTGHTAAFDGEYYTGAGIHLVLSRSGRNYGFVFLINDFTPTYQTYNGLFTSVGYHQFYLNNSYTFYPKITFIDRGQISLNATVRYDYDGIKKEQVIQPQLSATLKGQTNLYISYLAQNDELFRGVQFTGVNRGLFSIDSRPLDMLTFEVNGEIGKFIYRDDVPLLGRGHNLSASLTLLPTTRLNISLNWSRAHLSDIETKDLFFDGDIYRTVIKYQFSPRTLLRTIIEYNSFSETWNLYPLFSYKAGAFTTFYAGITNNFYDYGNPFGIRTTDRQYFLKLQYMIRT